MYNAYETATPAKVSSGPLSVVDAREELIVAVAGGSRKATCKCCLQHVQQYRIRVLSDANRQLLRVLAKNGKPMTVRQIYTADASVRRRRNWQALTLLGLVEKTADHKWKITTKGLKVYNGTKSVPTHIFTYNGEIVRSEARSEYFY